MLIFLHKQSNKVVSYNKFVIFMHSSFFTQALVKEHFEVQKTENVKESIQGELNLKNQIAKRNDELVKQQEIELKKLTVRNYF